MIFINWDVALGMAEAMRAESLKRKPAAMLSCAVVGIRGRALIVNLPGAPVAARENLVVLLPAVPHAVEKIHGEGGVCTGSTCCHEISVCVVERNYQHGEADLHGKGQDL